ncbi:hypothetical protein [Streptomyces sp. NBC_01304]|uniref:hypothetical protein n=1 Tax=Streptomyces sp. NBC_01304 TaxID=2903818 RepID=UPI002E14AFBD|nr:hypothetical protein OG430_24260 [Streptomyces sp. NBC_01304]
MGGETRVLLKKSVQFPHLIQELAMADVAFVVTTIAVFALVALIAKGVAKL